MLCTARVVPEKKRKEIEMVDRRMRREREREREWMTLFSFLGYLQIYNNYDIIFKIYSFNIRLNDWISSHCFIIIGNELYILTSL